MLTPRIRRNLKREFRVSLLAKIGVLLLGLVVFAAIFAPLIAPYNPTIQNLDNKNQPPVGMTVKKHYTVVQFEGLETKKVEKTVLKKGTWAHPLGTDPLGRDILSRIIYGARISFLVGIVSVLIGFLVGTAIGLISGYYRGWVDDVLMRAIDVRLSIPGLILAITFLAIFGSFAVPIPDPFVMLGLAPDMPERVLLPMGITIAIGVLSWDEFARVARSEALSLREEDYVKAARSAGAGTSFIIRRHLFPNAIASVMILATIRVATAILLESTLSFLGFSTTTLSWGFDIAVGRSYLATAWWVAVFPGLAIVIAVIGVNLIGDWLRDGLDPSTSSELGGL